MPSFNRLFPTGHSFGRPPLSASEPLPPATGAYPYRLDVTSYGVRLWWRPVGVSMHCR